MHCAHPTFCLFLLTLHYILLSVSSFFLTSYFLSLFTYILYFLPLFSYIVVSVSSLLNPIFRLFLLTSYFLSLFTYILLSVSFYIHPTCTSVSSYFSSFFHVSSFSPFHYLFVYPLFFFGRLKCVDHSFAYVAHFAFLE